MLQWQWRRRRALESVLRSGVVLSSGNPISSQIPSEYDFNTVFHFRWVLRAPSPVQRHISIHLNTLYYYPWNNAAAKTFLTSLNECLMWCSSFLIQIMAVLIWFIHFSPFVGFACEILSSKISIFYYVAFEMRFKWLHNRFKRHCWLHCNYVLDQRM